MDAAHTVSRTHTRPPCLGEYALLRYGARFALCVHVPQGFGHACMRRPVGGYVSASYPPRYPALTFSCFRAPPCTASCHAGTRGLAGRGVYTHAPPGEIRTVQMCRISQGGMSEHAPPCKIRTDQVCLASHEGCLCCVCVCVCLCLAAAASGPAT